MTTVKPLYNSELRHGESKKIMTGDFVRFWKNHVEKEYYAKQSETMKVSKQSQASSKSFMENTQDVPSLDYTSTPIKNDIEQLNFLVKQFVNDNSVHLQWSALTNIGMEQTSGLKSSTNNVLINTTNVEKLPPEDRLSPSKLTKPELISFFEYELTEQAKHEAVKVTILDDRVDLHIRDANLSTDTLKKQLSELRVLIKQHFSFSLASVSLNGQKVWEDTHDLLKNNHISSQYFSIESAEIEQTDTIIDKTF